MTEIKLNVYNEDMKTIKKECKAEMIEIPFGVIRKLMQLFNIDKLEDTNAILNIVMSSWENVVSLLDKIFPDMEEDDWDTVSTKELVQAIYAILKGAFKEMMSIPVDSKN